MARMLPFKKEDVLITSGSREKIMYIIMDGEVKVELSDGTKGVEVARLRKNDFFGEISFFSEGPRSATVTACTDGNMAVIDSLQQLNMFLMQNPKFAVKMVHILSQRLAKTDELLMGKVSDLHRLGALTGVQPSSSAGPGVVK